MSRVVLNSVSIEPMKVLFLSKLISSRRLRRIIVNALVVLIISIFRSKIFPSILRKVIVSVTSGIFLFNNQYPKK